MSRSRDNQWKKQTRSPEAAERQKRLVGAERRRALSSKEVPLMLTTSEKRRRGLKSQPMGKMPAKPQPQPPKPKEVPYYVLAQRAQAAAIAKGNAMNRQMDRAFDRAMRE